MASFNYIENNNGVIVPDTSVIQAEVIAEFQAVFGADLITDPSTPQGALIAMFTAERVAIVQNNAQLANQINPNLAGGVFLDALWALLGGQRTPATFSTVTVTVAGSPGTVIPLTSIATTESGDQFGPVEAITIGAGGNSTGLFRALVAGAVPIAASTLNQIQVGVLGWETITNAADGIVGGPPQSDSQVRLLRQRTLALQGQALPEAISSALLGGNIGVTSLTFQENTAATTQTINGVSMVAHSIYTCVTNNAPLNYTQVICTVTGDAGTIIPLGSKVSDGTHVFSSLESITLDSLGNGSGIFQADVAGATAIAAADLDTIVTAVSGWDTVTNPLPNTIYNIGFLTQVAEVLLAKKSAGAAWSTGPGTAPYGPQTINVVEPTSGQTYPVKFDTPTPIPILVQVTVRTQNTFVGDPVTLVQEAILTYAEGGIDGEQGFVVGGTVSAFELSAAINFQVPGLFVANVLTTKASSVSFDTTEIPIAVYQQATIQQSSISVFVL